MRTRITIFSVLAVLLILALVSGFVLVWRLLFILGAVVLVDYLWAALSIRGIRGRVMLPPGRCQVGDSFNEEVVLNNNSRMPKFYLEIRQNTDVPGQQDSLAINMKAGATRNLRMAVGCRQRGQYRVGSFTVTARGPFGLFSRRRQYGEPQSLTVCPATSDLPLFRVSAPRGSRYGGFAWTYQPSSTIGGVRHYNTGDSLKNIHWPKTMHTGKLLVKVLDQDRPRDGAGRLWLVVDMCRSACTGGDNASLEDHGLTVAASVARKFIGEGMAVGLIAAGKPPCLIPPDSGEPHFWHLLQAMALMKAEGDKPLYQVVSSEARRFTRDTALIIITPSQNEKLLSALRAVTTPPELTTIILLDGPGLEERHPFVITQALTSSGAQVHVSSPGKDLAGALDSGPSTSHLGSAQVPTFKKSHGRIGPGIK